MATITADQKPPFEQHECDAILHNSFVRENHTMTQSGEGQGFRRGRVGAAVHEGDVVPGLAHQEEVRGEAPAGARPHGPGPPLMHRGPHLAAERRLKGCRSDLF